jgi:hypothetical protein
MVDAPNGPSHREVRHSAQRPSGLRSFPRQGLLASSSPTESAVWPPRPACRCTADASGGPSAASHRSRGRRRRRSCPGRSAPRRSTAAHKPSGPGLADDLLHRCRTAVSSTSAGLRAPVSSSSRHLCSRWSCDSGFACARSTRTRLTSCSCESPWSRGSPRRSLAGRTLSARPVRRWPTSGRDTLKARLSSPSEWPARLDTDP